MDAKYAISPIAIPFNTSLVYASLIKKNQPQLKALPSANNRQINVNSLYQKQSYNLKPESWNAVRSVNKKSFIPSDHNALYLLRENRNTHQMNQVMHTPDWRKIAWTPILYKTSVYSDKLHHIVIPPMDRTNFGQFKYSRTPTETPQLRRKTYYFHSPSKSVNPVSKIIKDIKSSPIRKLRSQSVCNTFRKLFGKNDEKFEVTDKNRMLIYSHKYDESPSIVRRKFTVNIERYRGISIPYSYIN